MNKLLKCPFCGSDAMVMLKTPVVETIKEEWMVICQNPEPECNARLPYCNSEEEAIRQWNRRENIKGGVLDKYYSQCQELMTLIEPDCSWEFKDDTIIWHKEEDVIEELKKKDSKIERLEKIVKALRKIIKAKDVILKGVVY